MATRRANSMTGPEAPIGAGPAEPRRKATGATRKKAQPPANQPIADLTEDHIRVRAYFLSLERNGGPTDPIADWVLAERQLTANPSP